MNKVCIIGWESFREGFEKILTGYNNSEFISKTGFWRRQGLFKKFVYCSKFDVIHYFWGIANFWEILLLKLQKKNVILHFIGSDVLIVKKKWKKKVELRLLQLIRIKIYVVSNNLKLELLEMNIFSELLFFMNDEIIKHASKLPDSFSVIAYVPEGKENFYNLDVILDCAKKYPEITFTIFPNSKDIQLENVSCIPYIEHSQIFSEFTNHNLFVRITNHDGTPNTVLEALSCGLHVAWSENHEACNKINTTKELLDVIKNLSIKPTLNEEGKRYVLEHYSFELLKKKYHEIWSIK